MNHFHFHKTITRECLSLCVSLCLSFLSFSFCLLLSNKITYKHSDTHRVFVPPNHLPKQLHTHTSTPTESLFQWIITLYTHIYILYMNTHAHRVFVPINHLTIQSYTHIPRHVESLFHWIISLYNPIHTHPHGQSLCSYKSSLYTLTYTFYTWTPMPTGSLFQ